MKKFYTLFAALLFAGSMMAAQQVNVTINSNLIYTDAVEEDGWWQIWGSSDDYYITLSNSNEISQAPGTYQAADLDPDYSFFIDKLAPEDTITFVMGSVNLAVSDANVVTVKGSLIGNNGKTYNIDLTYKDPVAEQTVTFTIPNANIYTEYADFGLFCIFGEDENENYAQVSFWVDEDANDITGTYTDYDFDDYYLGTYVEIGDNDYVFFSGDLTIVAGETEGSYKVQVNLLCYNNTLYKVTMYVGDYTEGIADVKTEAKKTLVKLFRNGKFVIEKNGVRYNAGGMRIK